MPKAPSISRDVVVVLLAVLAAAVLAVGVWMIYPPAGVIVVGLSLLVAAVEVQSADS